MPDDSQPDSGGPAPPARTVRSGMPKSGSATPSWWCSTHGTAGRPPRPSSGTPA